MNRHRVDGRRRIKAPGGDSIFKYGCFLFYHNCIGLSDEEKS